MKKRMRKKGKGKDKNYKRRELKGFRPTRRQGVDETIQLQKNKNRKGGIVCAKPRSNKNSKGTQIERRQGRERLLGKGGRKRSRGREDDNRWGRNDEGSINSG